MPVLTHAAQRSVRRHGAVFQACYRSDRAGSCVYPSHSFSRYSLLPTSSGTRIPTEPFRRLPRLDARQCRTVVLIILDRTSSLSRCLHHLADRNLGSRKNQSSNQHGRLYRDAKTPSIPIRISRLLCARVSTIARSKLTPVVRSTMIQLTPNAPLELTC